VRYWINTAASAGQLRSVWAGSLEQDALDCPQEGSSSETLAAGYGRFPNRRAQFDAILCVFDSINHVRRFSDWKRVFARVRQHLSPGGCFIFDINTQRKLERHIAEPPWVHTFGRNLLIIEVTALANHGSNWNIKVFEQVNHSRYVLHEEDIVEVSFPLGKIMGALHSYFANVRVVDPDRRRPTEKSERLFFVAKRR